MTGWEWLLVPLVIAAGAVGLILERRERAAYEQHSKEFEEFWRSLSEAERTRVLATLEAQLYEEPPPKFADYLLYVFLPKHRRDNLLGDLAEEYRNVYQRFGSGPARAFYYSQVFRSLWPLIAALVQKALKWGILGWIGQTIRRFIS